MRKFRDKKYCQGYRNQFKSNAAYIKCMRQTLSVVAPLPAMGTVVSLSMGLRALVDGGCNDLPEKYNQKFPQAASTFNMLMYIWYASVIIPRMSITYNDLRVTTLPY